MPYMQEYICKIHVPFQGHSKYVQIILILAAGIIVEGFVPALLLQDHE
jgi:hypothetical protein